MSPLIVSFVILTALILFIYPFIVYPAIIHVLAKVLPANTTSPEKHQHSVALIICALNEENIIRLKLENSLRLSYPKDSFSIVLVSDGSTDRTAEIARDYEHAGVRVIEQPRRRGKIANLNEIALQLNDDILVFSDANVMYDEHCITRLVERFADPSVGCVSGKVVLTDSADGLDVATREYYSLEWSLQEHASSFYSMVGADGAMYALRRELYQPCPNDTLIEDFVIPMSVVRQGWRVVFERSAIAWERDVSSLGEEFRRKVRIAAGAFQAVARGGAWPGKASWRVWLVFVSHKLLRWLSPVFALIAFGAAVSSPRLPVSLGVLAGGFVLLVAAAARMIFRRPHVALDACFYFVFGQIAVTIGIWRGLTRTQSVLWAKANR